MLFRSLPTVVINGLSSATNLLPAIGLALLLQMTISKKMAPFFFIGFMMAAYLGMSTIAVTLFAVMFALIMISNKNDQAKVAQTVGGDDNEF